LPYVWPDRRGAPPNLLILLGDVPLSVEILEAVVAH